MLQPADDINCSNLRKGFETLTYPVDELLDATNPASDEPVEAVVLTSQEIAQSLLKDKEISHNYNPINFKKS